MQFTYKSISQSIKNGELDHDYISSLCQDPKLVSLIKSDSAGEGFGIHHKICDIIEEDFIANKINIDNCDINEISSYNFSYLLPNIFINSRIDKSKFFLKIKDIHYKILLTRKPIVQYIFEEFTKLVDHLSPDKLFTFLLACKGHNILRANDEEKVLREVIERIDCINKDEDLIAGLSKRLECRSKNKNSLYCAPKKNIALLITGQLRGYEKALPYLTNLFDDISKVDIYISTWLAIGYPRITNENLYRIFDLEAKQWVKENLHIDDINALFNSLTCEENNKDKILQSLKNIFPESSLNINIENEQSIKFADMTNPEKMYYHNNFWLDKLGGKFFQDKYELVIKSRPDIQLESNNFLFDKAIYSTNAIYTEDKSGWIYRDWGFGCGDQIIFGTPQSILPILSVHGDQLNINLSQKASTSGHQYAGHVNCGVQAWLNGIDCLPMPLIHKGLKPASILNLSETMDFFEINSQKS
jgi:hypothetical protein